MANRASAHGAILHKICLECGKPKKELWEQPSGGEEQVCEEQVQELPCGGDERERRGKIGKRKKELREHSSRGGGDEQDQELPSGGDEEQQRSSKGKRKKEVCELKGAKVNSLEKKDIEFLELLLHPLLQFARARRAANMEMEDKPTLKEMKTRLLDPR